MSGFSRALVSGVSLAAILVGCGGGGGGGGGAQSFSGTILGSTSVLRGGTGLEGLEGVVVEVSSNASTKQATTDSNGNFIVLKPPSGMVHVHIDGSGVAGGTFASLELALVVGGGKSNLSQPVVLPNLDQGQTLSVAVDGSGVTMGDMTVGDPMVDGFALDIPDMTTILVDGAVPTGPVTVNVTPVPAIDVPMPLPGTQNPGAFVTIQPPGASFSPALGITLPNTGNLPLGTLVDIWSFDHQDGAWVNRSEQTGHQGMVVDLSGTTFIVAEQVITEGGWHAGTIPVDPTCATTIAGQVFPAGSTTPLRDVLISLSTGQFARTDASGRFRIVSVPAYDASLLPKSCEPVSIDLRAIAPVAYGAGQVSVHISSGTIMTGGITDVPAFDIPVTSSGSLVGSVTESGNPVAGKVSITGLADVSVETDALGGFFVATLDPGAYSASFPFTGGDVAKNFSITANQTTVLNLAANPPSGGGTVNVQVIDFTDLDTPVPVESACVTLQGSSGAPRFAVANASGIASFSGAPSGPYNVTAQQDVLFGLGSTARIAASLIGVMPSGSPSTIVLPFFDDANLGDPVVTDATLDGTVLNDPGGVDFEYQVASNGDIGFQTTGSATGGFSDAIPSGVALDAVVLARDSISGEIVSAVFAPNLTATIGETLMVDFDFANACAFDQPVTLSTTNLQTHTDVFADLDLFGAGDLSLPFTDGVNLPTSVNWPDLSSSKLTGFELFFDVGSDNSTLIFEDSSCDIALGHTTPSSLTIDFLGHPTIQNPANNANFASYGPGSVVQYTLGTGNSMTDGFNSVTFFGESKVANLTLFWDILVAPNATSVTLPPVFTSKPMFPTGFYAVNVEKARFTFPGFSFASFFDANLPSNVAAIMASTICYGSQSHFFTVNLAPLQPDTHPGLRRRVARQKPPFQH